jgi:hypothetical protein
MQNAKLKILLTILCIPILGCSDASDQESDTHVMHFPTTSSCSAYTSEVLERLSATKDFEYKFNKVIITLDEVKSVNGFFTLTSTELDRPKLAEVWYEVMKDCYHTSSTTLSLGIEEWTLLRRDLLEMGVAAESYNAVLKDGNLTIYFEWKK